MNVTLHYQVNEMDGKKIDGKYCNITEDYKDPIFMNMQFCIEREQYNKLKKLCGEYKLIDIHNTLQTILEEVDPQQIIDLAAF